jgi:hypothetical protein
MRKDWPEDGAHIGGAEAVHLTMTEIRRERIDQDHPDVADLVHFLARQFNISDQAEHATAVGVANHLDDFDAIEIGTSRNKARHHGVAGV